MRKIPLIVFSLLFYLVSCTDNRNNNSNISAELKPEQKAQNSGKQHIQDHLKNGQLGPKLSIIPTGNNILGDISGLGRANEKPTYTVSIQKAFALGIYEVSFKEYEAFCNDTGRSVPNDESWGKDKYPVINVSWTDAVDYAKWLSDQTGKHYYLPSEAQWEYAARAGTKTNYWWGDKHGDANAQCGDCEEIYRCNNCTNVPLKEEGTVPVGSFKPNSFGLYDMHGNVMEWTADCWNENHATTKSDGSPRLNGDCKKRVIKDGSWWYNVNFIRASVRSSPAEGFDHKGNHVGFRVARDVD